MSSNDKDLEAEFEGDGWVSYIDLKGVFFSTVLALVFVYITGLAGGNVIWVLLIIFSGVLLGEVKEYYWVYRQEIKRLRFYKEYLEIERISGKIERLEKTDFEFEHEYKKSILGGDREYIKIIRQDRINNDWIKKEKWPFEDVKNFLVSRGYLSIGKSVQNTE